MATTLAPIELGDTTLSWERLYLMGVVNVTPDSFSDGGRYGAPAIAVAYAESLVLAGADLLDVGGESTRPGATPVDADEEIARIVPVIMALAARLSTPISVDTTKAVVAEAAIAAGASLVNDVSGGCFDRDILHVVADAGVAYICGHVRGSSLAEVHTAEVAPPSFHDVVGELEQRLSALPPGLRGRTIVDPCLGFGKRTVENLELSRRAGELGAALGRPVLLGPSRKRFLGELTGKPAGERDDATIGAALAASEAGAHIVRVHNIGRVRPALTVFEAVRRSS